jgi:hypothetical protein
VTPDPLTRLGALFAQLDPVPDPVTAAAAAITPATLPGTRLDLLRPPGGPVRGPGGLHFGTRDVRLDLHLEPGRLTGLLHAAAPATWLVTAGSRAVRPDQVGRFELLGLPRGPVRLTATHPAAGPRHTPWFVA